MRDIERRLRIQMRKLNGVDFGEWFRNLTPLEQSVFNKMWDRDSKKQHVTKTLRVLTNEK